jgi:endonuclease/exonuclease/phosphatase family metal-dependent hydrolase
VKIKVLQINTWDGGVLWENLSDFIKKEDPDIIFAQEVLGKTCDLTEQYFSYKHVYYSPTYIKVRPEGKFEEGNAIFSKFPIKESRYIKIVGEYSEWSDEQEKTLGYEKVPRVLQHVIVEVEPGLVFDLFNIHGIVDYRGSYDSPERLRMSEIIVEHIKNKQNVILSGDFNLRPDTQTIKNIEKHLTNVFKDELKSTFNMRRKDNPGYATSVVDMIFVSPNIKILDHSCPDVDVSDHYPLLAELEIGQNSQV